MGAHAPLLVRAPAAATISYNVKFFFTLLFLLSSATMSSSDIADADALLKFRDSLTNVVSLSSWDPSINPKPPCSEDSPNWVGVLCMNDNVWGLRLENMGLMGIIDVDSLAAVPFLRTISFMNNTFVGPIPNIKTLKNLRSLYLSYNHFSGDIPDDAFVGMNKLKKVHLANNQFTGKIPSSLATLPSLLVLRLESNKFQGLIPEFKNNKLRRIDVSNNELEGPIPTNLSSFDAGYFSGNPALCGKPLDPCPSTPEATRQTSKGATIVRIILLVLVIALVIALVVAAFIIFRLRSNQGSQPESDHYVSTFEGQASDNIVPSGYVKSRSMVERDGNKQQPADQTITHSKRGEQAGKLAFVRDDHKNFDLPDLLKASAEILGSAQFGSSYKAVIRDGHAVVVKRYKQMNNVPRDEFQEHMRRLGTLTHPNILPLVAYYYRKEEKLLVSDFVDRGCLASNLHGNHNSEQPGLEWPTRLRIVKGVARGLAHLYDALPSLVVPHGHLKSSNVLLDESYEPVLTDYALIPVINLDHAQQVMMPYKSPEYAQLGRITKKTDVWSFGILILEILTGRFPENYLTYRHNNKSDIASWVNAMITEKKTSDVFDIEMGGVGSSKGELLKLLKIGLSCCEENVERRLDMKEALHQIEELKDGESDDGEYSLFVTSQRDNLRAL